MDRIEYVKRMIELFDEIHTKYDCEGYIDSLNEAHLNKIKDTLEKDIVIKNIYKEPVLVRYYRKTCIEIEALRRAYNNMQFNRIGSKGGLKNDLFILRNFSEKLSRATKYKKVI